MARGKLWGVGYELGLPSPLMTHHHLPNAHHSHPRPAPVIFLTNTSAAGAEVTASAAAALAATSLLFQSSDAAFSAKALQHAQQLMQLAQQIRSSSNASYCNLVACCELLPGAPPQSGGAGCGGAGAGMGLTGGVQQTLAGVEYLWRAFPSSSVDDDMAWAAAWLFKATGELGGRRWLGEKWLQAHRRCQYELGVQHSFARRLNDTNVA